MQWSGYCVWLLRCNHTDGTARRRQLVSATDAKCLPARSLAQSTDRSIDRSASRRNYGRAPSGRKSSLKRASALSNCITRIKLTCADLARAVDLAATLARARRRHAIRLRSIDCRAKSSCELDGSASHVFRTGLKPAQWSLGGSPVRRTRTLGYSIVVQAAIVFACAKPTDARRPISAYDRRLD